jgi:threonine dehydrogenase-like Zn-dependent dehydrogenase
MRATCWHGTRSVRVDQVPEPKILNPRDAIVRITRTAICGSDLHLYNGFVPTMRSGDVLGHEFMGEVVETGSGVTNLSKGDRVVVPFPIACGHCAQCERELYSLCENSNPNAWMAEKMWGYSPCGIFGYSHMLGGYAGGQAEYARVPFADVGPLKVPDSLDDEQVLFLSDIFPTGYMAAEACNIQPGDTIAVWGCGPVGQFAIKSAYLLGAERVIAIDRFPYRLDWARERAGADTINYAEVDVFETDRPVALRQAILSCRSGGTVSVAGVYSGFIDKFPMGAIVNRSLTIKSGQTHVHRYMQPLLNRIERGDIDPSFVISHRMRLDDAPEMYQVFNNKEDECMKVVLRP